MSVSGLGPDPLVSLGSLLIGVAVVSVSLSDPVIRLSDYVRANGPIILSGEAAEKVDLAGYLPGIGSRAPVRTPEEVLALTSAHDAAPPAEEPAMVLALSVRTEPRVTLEHDAHFWAFLVATAPQREAALGLSRTQRIELQRRLALIGYDPGGADGILGPMSRAAIAAWQRDYGFPETGHVDAGQLASIEERTAEVWAAWQAEQARRARVTSPRPVAAPEDDGAPDSSDGCTRDEQGRIVGSQSFGCDLKGVKEGIQRLFSKSGEPGFAAEPVMKRPTADR